MSAAWKIIHEVSDQRGLLVDKVLSENRRKKYAVARFEIAYRLRRELGLSYPRIATHLGREDHTTALYAVGRYHAILEGLPLVRGMAKYAKCVEILPEATANRTAEFAKEIVDAPPVVAKAKRRKRPMHESKAIAHAHRASFVLQWIALEDGTPLEALEPYGFNEWETTAFLRYHYPQLLGLQHGPRRELARSMLLDIGVAA